MVSIRRLYIFLVAAISLWAVASAVTALLQNVIPPGSFVPVTTTALLIAVIVIAMPFYLAHWLWAQRLARDPLERGSLIRRVYLYAMLAIFLGWFISNAYELVAGTLRLLLGLGSPFGLYGVVAPTPLESVSNAVVGILVAAGVWVYHEFIVRQDDRVLTDTQDLAVVRRVYIYFFAGVGLLMAGWGISQTLRLVLNQIGAFGGLDRQALVTEIARLAVGLPVWIIFWRWGQRLYRRQEAERESVVRKLYLYVVIFLSASITVGLTTVLFAGVLRTWMGLPSSGDLRDPLSIILIAGAIWAFHWFVLRQETASVQENERQAGLRRLYWYLVAAIGLGAFLIGLGGVVSVLISVVFGGDFFGAGLKEQLAWCTAALVAGLPVWLIPWRKAQTLAVQDNPQGEQERRSIIRKGYLYLFLLIASLTILGCAIYILWRFLSVMLGERIDGNLLTELAYPFAFGLIGAGVWVVHGLALRGDAARFQKEASARRAAFSIGIADEGEASFGHALVAELNRTLPGLTIVPQGFAIAAEGTGDAPAVSFAQSKVIVASWKILAKENADTSAFRASEGQKWIVPTPVESAQWLGVDASNPQALAQEAARAVKRVIEGEATKARRGLHPAVIIVLVLIGLCILFQVITFVWSQMVMRF